VERETNGSTGKVSYKVEPRGKSLRYLSIDLYTMSASRASAATDNTRIPECVTRDDIRPLLEAQLASYKKKAEEAKTLNDKSFLSCIDPCYKRDKDVFTAMANSTTAALSGLEGDATNLPNVIEAREEISKYRLSVPTSSFAKEDKLLFQASLFAKYPKDNQVYVKDNSEYPGLFFNTSECLRI
jgi:hypothetical protein